MGYETYPAGAYTSSKVNVCADEVNSIFRYRSGWKYQPFNASLAFRANRNTLPFKGMEIAPHVTIDPGIHHGAPVVSRTRVPVATVIGSLAGGMTWEDV